MKHLLVFATLFTGAVAHAQNTSGWLERFETRVRTGVEACGLQTVSGQDHRLDYRVRARNVDYVVVRPTDFEPGVLVDRDIQGRDLTLAYNRADNGSHLMTMRQDYDMNDVALDTVHEGRVAYTRSYFRNRVLETRYYVKVRNRGQQEVSEETFARYLDVEAADSFVAFVCRDAR